jgi:hypothetical protein
MEGKTPACPAVTVRLECWWCHRCVGTAAELRCCDACNGAVYCSAACQAADEGHAAACRDDSLRPLLGPMRIMSGNRLTLKRLPGKGRGVFAAVALAAAEFILVDSDAVMVNKYDRLGLAAMWHKLPLMQLLAHAPMTRKPADPVFLDKDTRVHAALRHAGLAPVEDMLLPKAVLKTVKRKPRAFSSRVAFASAAMRTRVDMNKFGTHVFGLGIMSLGLTLVNHSCKENVEHFRFGFGRPAAFDPYLYTVCTGMVAKVPIAPGTELAFLYSTCDCVEYVWGFRCTDCTGDGGQQQRTRLPYSDELERAIDAYYEFERCLCLFQDATRAWLEDTTSPKPTFDSVVEVAREGTRGSL